MQKYSILLGFFDKQLALVLKLYQEIVVVDVGVYEKRYLFALKTQQFYTAVEDLFKQIAKAFENHIQDLSTYHKELLIRMGTEIPKIRPAVVSQASLLFLDKIRAFRHFVRHAYDCELDQRELEIVQSRLRSDFPQVQADVLRFREYVAKLIYTDRD